MSIGPLDKQLPVPLYHQLLAVLKAEIEAGKWQPDEQLPNESKIGESFGVSKITVRQALEGLAELGYIRREHGRGTFVTRRKFDEGPHELRSFTEEMRRHGLGASSKILAQLVTEADFEIAAALQLPVQSPVFVLKRVRLANGEPVSIQTAHIPAALVPGLEVAEGDSLYKALEANYRLYAARARETYFASSADPSTALELGIPANSPVFAVERVTLLLNEKPFEFVRSTIRGDRYSIVLDLVQDGSKKTAPDTDKSRHRGGLG